MKLTFQPVPVDTGGADEDGCLMFADHRLVAVLVRLSEQHGEAAGNWYFEHGFGRLDGPSHPIFTELEDAQDWVIECFTQVERTRLGRD